MLCSIWLAYCFVFDLLSAAGTVPHADKGASLVAQCIVQSLLPKQPICALCQGARDARALHLPQGCRALQSVQASVAKLQCTFGAPCGPDTRRLSVMQQGSGCWLVFVPCMPAGVADLGPAKNAIKASVAAHNSHAGADNNQLVQIQRYRSLRVICLQVPSHC